MAHARRSPSGSLNARAARLAIEASRISRICAESNSAGLADVASGNRRGDPGCGPEDDNCNLTRGPVGLVPCGVTLDFASRLASFSQGAHPDRQGTPACAAALAHFLLLLRGRHDVNGFCRMQFGSGRLARLGPSSIPSLGDGDMLGTAWIDRPVDTRGCTPLPRPFRAAWKCSHARAICDR